MQVRQVKFESAYKFAYETENFRKYYAAFYRQKSIGA